MKWYIRILFTLAFIASWLAFISGWGRDQIILTIIGIICVTAYTLLFILILIDLFSETVEAFHYRQSLTRRRFRYSLFRSRVKAGKVKGFEDEAKEAIE